MTPDTLPSPNEDQKPLKVRLDLSNIKMKYVVLFLAALTGTAGAIIGIYTYTKFASNSILGTQVSFDRPITSQKEIASLVSRVSQVAQLPEGEVPQVLVISDLTQLKANPFFTDAKLKDIIMIYPKAQKVFLYDPIDNKIINIGPYVDPKNVPSPTPSPKESTKSAKTKEATPESSPQP